MIERSGAGRAGAATPGAWGLSALFGAAGVAHLVRPAGFDALVPTVLPGSARFWTVSSGLVEVALAAGLALRPTRSTASLAAAGFLVAVWPANGKMALDAWGRRHRDRAAAVRCAVSLLRLPLQVPLVGVALRAHRGARPGHR